MAQIFTEPFDDTSWTNTFTSAQYTGNTAIVADARNSQPALRVRMPTGGHWGNHSIYNTESEDGTDHEEMYARFYGMVPSDFYLDGGGKFLGGFAGIYGDGAGRGGSPSDGTNSWTTRMRFDPGSGEGYSEPVHVSWYAYHADMSGTFGETLPWDDGSGGQFTMARDTWYEFEIYQRMNTPGQNDGVLRAWVDGDLAFERTDMSWRNSGYSDHRINEFWQSTYYGGSWESPDDNDVFIDALEVHDTNEHQTGSGSTSYDTITVPADTTHTVNLSDGDVYENKLIDITASGASVEINAIASTDGGHVEVRNIGIDGPQGDDTVNPFNVAANHENASVTVKDVWLGNGVEYINANHTAVWVRGTAPVHYGTATFRRMHIVGFTDNGIYGSGPGAQVGPEQGGEVHIDQCYAYANNISNYRIGTNGSTIRNSVSLSDGNEPAATTGVNARGIWAREGMVNGVIEDVDVDFTANATGGGALVCGSGGEDVDVYDSEVNGPIEGCFTLSNVGTAPDTSVPPGVPTSAVDAASTTVQTADMTAAGAGVTANGLTATAIAPDLSVAMDEASVTATATELTTGQRVDMDPAFSNASATTMDSVEPGNSRADFPVVVTAASATEITVPEAQPDPVVGDDTTVDDDTQVASEIAAARVQPRSARDPATPPNVWTLALSPTGDLMFNELNRFARVEGARAVEQDLRVSVATIEGEDPLDEEFGFDPFTASRTTRHLKHELRKTLEADVRVSTVPRINVIRPQGDARENVRVEAYVKLLPDELTAAEGGSGNRRTLTINAALNNAR